LRSKVNNQPYQPTIVIEEVKSDQLKLWAKFINHQYAAWSALFELITGEKPPKMKEILAIISGH
jgi:hypothetical protein